MNQTVIAALLLLTAPLAAQGKKVDFARQVFPILEKNCVECHRAPYVDENGRRQRPKGRVMLDTRANIESSKRGKLFVAGKPDDSMVIESIVLPADDEDRMPPPKKGGPLSKQDVETIRRWIDEGADFGSWTGEDVAAAKPKPDSKPTRPSSRPTPRRRSGPAPSVALSKGVNPLPEAKLAPFAAGPFQVRSIGDQNPLLFVSCCGKSEQVRDRDIATLEPIASHVFELDLARSGAGDDACAVIARMPRLTDLDLRGTRVTDEGVKLLAACKELRTLNLFDTEISDYSLLALEELEHLENLYVWQTDVTAKAVVRLREKLPHTRIVFAPDLPEPSEEPQGTGRRRR